MHKALHPRPKEGLQQAGLNWDQCRVGKVGGVWWSSVNCSNDWKFTGNEKG